MTQQNKNADDLRRRIANLESQIKALSTSDKIGNGSTNGGTTTWKDPSGNVQVIVGLLPDGTYGIQIGSVKIAAANGNMTGVGAINASGDVTAHGINTDGSQSLQFHVAGTAFYITGVS